MKSNENESESSENQIESSENQTESFESRLTTVVLTPSAVRWEVSAEYHRQGRPKQGSRERITRRIFREIMQITSEERLMQKT